MSQFETNTYVMLYFQAMPENILERMEADVVNLAKTYPQAIELLAPVRDFCLHMEEQSEKQLKAMAIEVGLAPFMYEPEATELNVGYAATEGNMAEVQAIIAMVEDGFQYLLKTPMRYLEYAAGIAFEENSEAIKHFLSMKSVQDAQNHKPIKTIGYQAEPNVMKQKCLAKVLKPLQVRDTNAVWTLRYIAKFVSTQVSSEAEKWLDGLYSATTFAHIVNQKNPKASWEQLCSCLPLDLVGFFGELGCHSEEEQIDYLDDYLKKALN